MMLNRLLRRLRAHVRWRTACAVVCVLVAAALWLRLGPIAMSAAIRISVEN